MNIDWYAFLAFAVFCAAFYSGFILVVKSWKTYSLDYVLSINIIFLALTNFAIGVVIGYAFWTGDTQPSTIGVVIRPALLLFTTIPTLILKRLGI